MKLALSLAISLLYVPALAQSPAVDQATLDKAFAACSKHLLNPDGHQNLGSGPGQRASRFEPAWESSCEPVWQEWKTRDNAAKAADEAANPDLKAARDAARALGALK